MTADIQNRFGFKHMPFIKQVSTSDLFQSISMKQVRDSLRLAVENEDFALLSGSPGSGKSSAIRKFLHDLDPNDYPWAYITAERYSIGDVAKAVLHSFHCTVPHRSFTALREFRSFIGKTNSEKNAKPVVVIDEAQELPLQTFRSIKNMANFEIDGTSRLTIIFCGQSELVDIMKSQQLESLRRRIRIRYLFRPMSIEETLAYIDHHLKRSGATKAIFTDDCKSEIFKLSQGNVSNINNICFDLLRAATEQGKDIIEPSMMEHIIVEN